MRDLEKIGEELFDKIRSRFNKVTLGGEDSTSTSDPLQARFFNFDYTVDGENFGNVTVSILDEQSLRVYFSKNITSNLDADQRQQWYSFLKSLRLFAKQNLLNFDTHDISRANLDIQDIRTIAKSDRPSAAGETQVGESKNIRGKGSNMTDKVEEGKMYGSRRRSYESCGNAKILVRHSGAVDDEVRGARSRKIESIFIENADGERFRMPFTKLTGARAMATHINEGGSVNDEIGTAIVDMVSEMNDMSVFVRKTQSQQFEDATTQKMVEAAKSHYNKVKETLHRMNGTRGYSNFVESYSASECSDDGYDADEMKSRFSRTTFDDRLEGALPRVFKAFKASQQSESACYESAKSTLTQKGFKLQMSESDMDSVITSMQFKNTNSLISHVLGEVAERAMDDSIREFASLWASRLGTLNEDSDETIKEAHALAAAITTQYLRSVNEGKQSPKEKIKELDDEIKEDVDEFEQWADGIAEGVIDYIGRKTGMKVTWGQPSKNEAPNWASFIGQTPEGAWHWLSDNTPVETDDSDRYFPNSKKTEFTGYESDPVTRTGIVMRINELLESGRQNSSRKVPDTIQAANELRDLMANPIEVGVDGDNATNAISHLIDDDSLIDMFYDAEPDEDARLFIKDWLDEYLMNDGRFIKDGAVVAALNDIANPIEDPDEFDGDADDYDADEFADDEMEESVIEADDDDNECEYCLGAGESEDGDTCDWCLGSGRSDTDDDWFESIDSGDGARPLGFLESVNLLKKLSGI